MVAVLLVLGTAGTLFAAIGMVRMPDVLMRLQAVTKAAAFGVGSFVIATAIGFWRPEVTVRVMLAQTFVILTAPLAAHVIARAAMQTHAHLWPGTRVDEYPQPPRSEPPPSPP